MAIDKLNPTDKKEFAAMASLLGIASAVPATASVAGVVKQATTVSVLTDSSGGTTGGNTIPAVALAVAAATDTTAAQLTSVNAAITALRNDIATLAACLNATITADKTAGQMA